MVCSWRALEATLPPESRILDDPYARGFLGPVRRRFVDGVAVLPVMARRVLLRQLDRALQGAYSFVLARHRAIDDLILSNPSDQLVFLGAGYDTRPARLSERLRQSRVFEVDHPDTARRKADLSDAVYADARLAPTVPVTIDFNRDSLEHKLLDAGLDSTAATVWVWEGVSMYLAEAAVRDTLGLFGRLSGPGSLVVCDLLSESGSSRHSTDAQLWVMNLAMEWFYSEPFLWYCPQHRVAAFFASCGLEVTEDWGLDELSARYGAREKGWLSATPSLRLIVARPESQRLTPRERCPSS
jgi:methyltransferase (TIGR00027 family)